MKIYLLRAACAAVFFAASSASALVTVTLYENNAGNVLLMETAGGTLNLEDRTSSSEFELLAAGMDASAEAFWTGGTTGSSNDGTQSTFPSVTYSGASFASFLNSSSLKTAGTFFGVSTSENSVFTSSGGSALETISASRITFSGHSLSMFGLSPGNTGMWSWGTGANADSITLTVVVPEPRVYAALAGLAALGFVVYRRRLG